MGPSAFPNISQNTVFQLYSYAPKSALTRYYITVVLNSKHVGDSPIHSYLCVLIVCGCKYFLSREKKLGNKGGGAGTDVLISSNQSLANNQLKKLIKVCLFQTSLLAGLHFNTIIANTTLYVFWNHVVECSIGSFYTQRF